MSAPLTLTAYEVESLAKFLKAMTEATRLTHVWIASYGTAEVQVNGTTSIGFAYESSTEQYVLNDRVGS